MGPKYQRLAMVCAALVGASLLVFGLRVICASDLDRVAMLPDDAFYYLTLARNFAADGVWSFDGGVSLTTGFHPLFAYLLVPLASEGRGAIDLASALVFVVSSATFGVALWRTRARADVMLALALVVGSAVVMLLTTIVIEWAFAVLFMGLFWAELSRGDGMLGDPRVRWLAALWIILAVLARTDSVLLVGAFIPAEVMHVVRAKKIRWRAVVPLLGAVVGYVAVMLHSAAIAGELSQSSASTKLDWAMSQGISPGPVITLVAQVLSPVELRFNLGLSGSARVAIIATLALAIAALTILARRANRASQPLAPPLPRPLVLAALLTLGGYLATYSFNSAAMDTWYTAPFIAPLVILIAVALRRLAQWLPFPVLAALLVAYLGAHGVVAHRMDDHRAAQRATFALASDTRAHVATHRTGALNAGLFGFVQDGKVINLDGLVNADIAAYRRQDRLACYLLDQRIEYLEDVDLLPRDEAYWRRHGDPQMHIRAALSLVESRVVAEHSAELFRVDLDALAAHCR